VITPESVAAYRFLARLMPDYVWHLQRLISGALAEISKEKFF
jgi:hypothetical protein